MDYSYKTSLQLSLMRGTQKLLNLDCPYCKDYAIIRGQLQTLFGNPIYIEPDFENAYCYIVIMENSEGAQFILTVYQGKSGPVIGGNKNIEGTENAAQELKRYIEKASPSDYEYEGIYREGRPNTKKIIMGVKNGKPYYSETKIASEIEIEEEEE